MIPQHLELQKLRYTFGQNSFLYYMDADPVASLLCY